jgi:hypothetical protein
LREQQCAARERCRVKETKGMGERSGTQRRRDSGIPSWLGWVVGCALVCALAVWALVALQRLGWIGSFAAPEAAGPVRGQWSDEMHRRFRQDCTAALVDAMPAIPTDQKNDEGKRDAVARLRLWLAGACDCIHYRVADRVPYEQVHVLLFGNRYAEIQPQYRDVQEQWQICLRSNKDSMAPTSPDQFDFPGGAAR